MVIERVQQMSVEEFLDFAESNVDRYEYIDGELYQMTAGKLNHFRIINSVLFLLNNRLEDTDCEAIGSGMLVRAGKTRLVAPDVIVVCGDPRNRIRYTSAAQSHSCRGSDIAIVNRP